MFEASPLYFLSTMEFGFPRAINAGANKIRIAVRFARRDGSAALEIEM